MLEVRLDATNSAPETVYLNNATPFGVGVGAAGSRLMFKRGTGSWTKMSYIEGGNANENSSVDGYISLGVKTNNVFKEIFRSSTNKTVINDIVDLSISGGFQMAAFTNMTSLIGDNVTANARGAGAVDWQLSRLGATQIASGAQSTISGGIQNTAAGAQATVTGGYANSSGGTYSVSGGYGNIASAYGSSVPGGGLNTASANYSWVPGGYGAVADKRGQGAWGSGLFATFGDAQAVEAVFTGTSATTNAFDLLCNTTMYTLSVGRALNADLYLVAASVNAATNAVFHRSFGMVNAGGTTRLIGAVQTVGTDQLDTGAELWIVTITADDGNDAIKITVAQNEGSTPIGVRWVGRLTGVEVSYP
jgi:hypothetical protein